MFYFWVVRRREAIIRSSWPSTHQGLEPSFADDYIYVSSRTGSLSTSSVPQPPQSRTHISLVRCHFMSVAWTYSPVSVTGEDQPWNTGAPWHGVNHPGKNDGNNPRRPASLCLFTFLFFFFLSHLLVTTTTFASSPFLPRIPQYSHLWFCLQHAFMKCTYLVSFPNHPCPCGPWVSLPLRIAPKPRKYQI